MRYTHSQVLYTLRTLLRLHYRSQSEIAREIGVSRMYISEVVRGKKPVGPKILAWLGFKSVPMYERTKP